LNAWMSRRVLRAGPTLGHKRLLVASIWLMPLLGALTALSHIRFHAPDPGSRLFGSHRVRPALLRPDAPEILAPDGAGPFAIRAHLTHPSNGTPVLDGTAVNRWLEPVSDDRERAAARQACQHAWLLHVRDALGPNYHLLAYDRVDVLSSLGEARAIGEFFARVTDRIGQALQPLAWHDAVASRSVMILPDCEPDWLSHVGSYDHECNDLPEHSGVFITSACPHFAARLPLAERMELFVAWELARQALVHLPMPIWLQYGIASNTAERVTGARLASLTPDQMHYLQQQFWTERGIHAFWSGSAFHPDDEQLSTLAGDLARRLVESLGRDWEAFSRFAAQAMRPDAGAQSACDLLGVDLGEAVCAVLGRPAASGWAPAE